jgi:Zn finger protein HypA/HybF involved in hydrogenase expression
MLTRCPACHWEGSIDIPFFICKQCGKGGLETLTGKELYVKEMEIAEDES